MAKVTREIPEMSERAKNATALSRNVAKELGLDSVPIQKVELPYKGYKSVSDLLWFE